MTSSSKKSAVRATRAKAAKPELSPLAPHLAALLNPALVEPAAGFEEAAQAVYDSGAITGLDPADVEKYGLDDGAGGDAAETRPKTAAYRPRSTVSISFCGLATPTSGTRRPGRRIVPNGRKNPRAASNSSWCRSISLAATSRTPSRNW